MSFRIARLAQACEEILIGLPGALPGGYTSEVCTRVAPWIGSLGACLARGLLLLSDYGLPRRHSGQMAPDLLIISVPEASSHR